MKNKGKGHFELLLDVGDMAALLAGSSDVKAFLNSTVAKVAEHMSADVCSIYLFEESSNRLVLRATVGLSTQAVDRISLAPGEGLVGQAMKELRPIVEEHASASPHFKYFESAAEDQYDLFIAVPIMRGVERIGVLVVQRKAGPFSDQDIRAMRVLASQLAGAVENARSVLLPPEDESKAITLDEFPKILRGRAVSEGVASGLSTLVGQTSLVRLIRTAAIEEIEGHADFEQLEHAVGSTINQLTELQNLFDERLPEMASLIFSAHIMMLKDSKFSGKMLELVRDGETGQRAVVKVARGFMDLFSRSSHDYMKEKARDVEDLAIRLLQNMDHNSVEDKKFRADDIVVARELFPFDMLKLACERVRAVVLTSGGVTSHIAILARSLQLPMIIVNEPKLLSLRNGTMLAVDGYVGNLYVNPDAELLHQFAEQNSLARHVAETRASVKDQTCTADGERIRLMANINLLSELPLARELKAEGVGLYRTEFPFLINTSFPSREQQRQVYERLIDSMDESEITIRTLDVGGDKVLAYFDNAGETNPALGLRSIRFSFRYPEIFKDQIAAILMAAGGKNVRIMFPMISSIDDFNTASAVMDECLKDIEAEGQTCLPLSKGIMIELPSVLDVIDDLAKAVDFFSIGTNDFVQYMLAVDRTNERVADLYDPWHPSVLRGINRVVAAALEHGVDVSVCGEMAHDPICVKFFVGIGVRKLSVDPHFIPALQESIAQVSIEQAEKFAARMLAESSIKGIRSLIAEDQGLPA